MPNKKLNGNQLQVKNQTQEQITKCGGYQLINTFF